MNNCIKTGARVWLIEYNETFAADLFAVGDCVVVNMNPHSLQFGRSEKTTHHLAVAGQFFHKDKGVIVLPSDRIFEVAE